MNLTMVTAAMLAVTATCGAVYAYLQRGASPYAPRMRDYLGDRRS